MPCLYELHTVLYKFFGLIHLKCQRIATQHLPCQARTIGNLTWNKMAITLANLECQRFHQCYSAGPGEIDSVLPRS